MGAARSFALDWPAAPGRDCYRLWQEDRMGRLSAPAETWIDVAASDATAPPAAP